MFVDLLYSLHILLHWFQVGSAKSVEPGESSQAVKEPGNTNRKRQTQNLGNNNNLTAYLNFGVSFSYQPFHLHAALGPPIVEAVQNNEKADNKRYLYFLHLYMFSVEF